MRLTTEADENFLVMVLFIGLVAFLMMLADGCPAVF
jgi:hypothetical protein